MSAVSRLPMLDVSNRGPQIVARSYRHRQALEQAGQLTFWACFDAPADHGNVASNDDDGDDDPLILAPIIHNIVKASDCTPPATIAPRSVFDLAGHQVVAKAMRRKHEPREERPRQIQTETHLRVTKEFGITRVVRMHHTETEEWKERETARRARQIVPKPSKQSFELGKAGRKKVVS
jgi:hypothetical protein